MCIADSVYVFPLFTRCLWWDYQCEAQCKPRREREMPIPLWIDDNTPLGKGTQKPFFRSRGFYQSAGARIPVVGHRMKGRGSNPIDWCVNHKPCLRSMISRNLPQKQKKNIIIRKECMSRSTRKRTLLPWNQGEVDRAIALFLSLCRRYLGDKGVSSPKGFPRTGSSGSARIREHVNLVVKVLRWTILPKTSVLNEEWNNTLLWYYLVGE